MLLARVVSLRIRLKAQISHKTKPLAPVEGSGELKKGNNSTSDQCGIEPTTFAL